MRHTQHRIHPVSKLKRGFSTVCSFANHKHPLGGWFALRLKAQRSPATAQTVRSSLPICQKPRFYSTFTMQNGEVGSPQFPIVKKCGCPEIFFGATVFNFHASISVRGRNDGVIAGKIRSCRAGMPTARAYPHPSAREDPPR